MRRVGRAVLPLAVWAGALSALAVLAVAGVAAAVLLVRGGLDGRAGEALAAGCCAGLLVCLLSVLAAVRLATALRVLHAEAARRLGDPAAPTGTAGPGIVTRASVEVSELASVLAALQLRVRVADELGERHRKEAQNAGAGVFELLSGLVAAEEGARGQLAAELHDTVAQSLMIARGLLAMAPSSPQELATLSNYVEDAEEQVRAVMARTRPPALRDGDLASAIDNLRLDMNARYGLQVAIEWPDSPYPLPLASAITVYRFCQEALLNVVKHADVEGAVVSLLVHEDAVLAEVRDEGPGFDPLAVRPDRGRHVGLGLLGERARLSGGSLQIASGRGEGTVLTLRLPRPAGGPPTAAVPAAQLVGQLPVHDPALQRLSGQPA